MKRSFMDTTIEPCVKRLDIEGHHPVIDWLMYSSYKANRERSPNVEPGRWREIYFNQETYEKIYQGEQNVHSNI